MYLAMSKEQLGQGNSFWEVDQSWAFPNSLTEDNRNKSAEPSDQQAAKGKKRNVASGRKDSDGDDRGSIHGGGDQSDDHELHIWTERERRKRMRNMFENLHSLLPHLPSKIDKSSIVDEAVSHIKKLEHTLKTLQKQKLVRALHGVNIIIDDHDVPSTKTVIQSREVFLADHHGSAVNSIPNPNSYVPAIFKTWTSPNVILNVCGNDAQISICSTKKPGLLTKICFVVEKNKLEVLSAHVSSDTYQCMYMIHARANGEQAYTVEEIFKQAVAEILMWVKS